MPALVSQVEEPGGAGNLGAACKDAPEVVYRSLAQVFLLKQLYDDVIILSYPVQVIFDDPVQNHAIDIVMIG